MRDDDGRSLWVCPICHGPLSFEEERVVCVTEKLAFPMEEGIPVLLSSEAKPL